jgi:hypothetical protein
LSGCDDNTAAPPNPASAAAQTKTRRPTTRAMINYQIKTLDDQTELRTAIKKDNSGGARNRRKHNQRK